MKKINALALTAVLFLVRSANAADGEINAGFTVPKLTDMISFLVKFLLFFSGLAALLYLLLGAFAWVTSSGDKENLKKAQDKIQAAVIGLILVVGVLILLVTLEQVILKNVFCVGLTCNLNSAVPTLVK